LVDSERAGGGRIGLAREGDVARLTIDNPARLNAMNGAMLADLDHALKTIEEDAAVRVVVIGAAEGRFFSAGADIHEWSALSTLDLGRRWIRGGLRLFDRLAALDAVTISVLHADTFGGGIELALATDFRVAGRSARFALPETGIGAVPGWLGAARLVPLVGLARARRMALLGEIVDAPTALDWGLVDRVAEAGEIDAAVDELIATVRARSASAIALTKRLLLAGVEGDRLGALHELAATVARATPDGEEGVAAFKAKRKPRFPKAG
jgi:enoyl-CoA hydratase/carnithine racemase